MLLVLTSFSSNVGMALAQQNGPPSSGTSAALQFTPATVNLIAGLNGTGAMGDGGLATAATLNYPVGVAYDSNGNLYIADATNYAVRKIDTSGNISLFAGDYSFGNTAPAANTQATSIGLGILTGLAVDSNNNVYFGDRSNMVIWKVNTSGVITIFAGTLGSLGYTGDTGLATAATIDEPYGLAFDATGNLYFTDYDNNVVRVIGTNGKINTFAGNGTDYGQYSGCPATYTGNGAAATSAELCHPMGVAADSLGNVYISSFDYNQVYIVGTNGKINVFAGTGTNTTSGYTGDGGAATSAELLRPEGLLTAPGGDVYIVDQGGEVIREVDSSGIINTVYGTNGGDLKYGGNSSIGEPDTETVFFNVGPADGIYYIAMDPYGNTVAASSSGDTITSAGSVGQYVFPNQQIYSTSNPFYTFVSNPSGVAINFTGTPAITGPFAIDGGTCDLSGTLAAGADCTIGITFTPTADQLYTGSIVLTSNSNSSPSSINLSGTGTGFVTPSATLLPNPLPTFTSPANVTSAAETATLTNTGVIPIAIGGTQFSGVSAAHFALAIPTSTDCPATLGVGDSCHFYVTFTPNVATTYTAGFGVEITTESYGYLNIGLNGTGTASLTAQAINFTQPTSPVTYSAGLTIPLVATGGASDNTIVFSIDGSSTGTGSITGSTLTVTGIGNLVIDANQAGNASYSAAPQVQRTVVVNQAAQTINFTQPTSPVTFSTGLTIPLSATGGASGNPIVFSIDGSSTGTGSITGSTLTVTGIGNLVIDANQAGNANYSAAPQVQKTIVVNALTAQVINFTQPTSPVTYSSGLTIPLVATGGASGNPIVFSIDGSSTGTGTISGSTLTVTGTGNLVIDANQAGNSTYSAAPQVQRTLVVNQALQAINFTQPNSPVTYSSGLTIPLSATGGASGNPVVFSIDGSSTGTGSITGSTLTVTGIGNLVIDANQAGNATYSAAPQVQKTIVVNALTADFSIDATPSMQTVTGGSVATYNVTVASVNGDFNNAVRLSATGVPTGATAMFTPGTVTPGSESAPSVLTIQTTTALAQTHAPPIPERWSWMSAVTLAFCIPLLWWRRRNRQQLLVTSLLCALLCVGASMLSGCGGGYYAQTPAQTYSITVTGASGSIQHSTTVTLTVQ